jgi:hypothetical protein
MFGRKVKAAEVSSSRFCMRAEELPYAHVYRYGRFTVAISKLSIPQSWPSRGREDVKAYGLLHGSMTFDDGMEEPVLPVELTFWEDRFDPERFGSAHFDRSSNDGAYVLNVLINDRTGDVLRAFAAAMERAVASGYSFMHVHCVKDRERDAPAKQDWRTQMDTDREFLRRVESGDAELESLEFDRVLFEAPHVTKAPSWTWAWEGWEFDQPRFQSKATAKWRRKQLPYRL